jgi:glycosyltransferase involved in cell wall biosynthesis
MVSSQIRSRLKIVILSAFAESLVTVRSPFLRALARAGHAVTACAPGEDPVVASRLKDIGVAYHSVKLDRTGMNPLRDLRFMFGFARFLQTTRPDIFLGYNIKPVLYGSLAARRARVPRIFSLMSGLGYAFTEGNAKQRLLGRVVRSLCRLALPNNDAVFFQNPDDLKLFLDLRLLRDLRQAVRINGSGVDLEAFGATPVSTQPLVFILIARLLRDKGVLEYVEVARLLKHRYPDVRFELLGRFDTNPSAIDEEQVGSWQRDGFIDYLGAATDVRSFVANSSVFVLPSYREGTPMSVLEAMAMARPIVTTDVPGCRETVIEGENGFLVPARNVNALFNAMERFIRSPDLIAPMGRRSREIAVERFDVNKVNAVIFKTMGL